MLGLNTSLHLQCGSQMLDNEWCSFSECNYDYEKLGLADKGLYKSTKQKRGNSPFFKCGICR